MKTVKLFFGISLLLLACNTQKKDQPKITGQLQHAAGQKIYFEKITSEGDLPVDSAVADAGGKFSLLNKADGLDYYLLRTGDRQLAYLILKGGETVSVTGDAKDLDHTYEVEGSGDTKLLLSLKRYDAHVSDSLNVIYDRVRDQPYLKVPMGAVLERSYDSLMRSFAVNLITGNMTSLVSLSATQYLDKQHDAALFYQLDDSLKKALGDNRYVAVYTRQVEDMKHLPPGSMAPDIRLPSPEGKEIALSSLKGKVVVIDFWASWCGPCRREMPEMVSLYNSFKNRGLEIFGVSLDENADAWKTAIAHDKISWIQVSDLKKWDSKVVEQYGIEEIPQTILLDREGKIIAKGLSSHELQIRIGELLMQDERK